MNRIAMVFVSVVALSCSRGSSGSQGNMKDAQTASRLHALNQDVHVAMDAVGAGRMFLDSRSRWLTAEVVEWRNDLDTPERLDLPPVVRTVDLSEHTDDRIVNGWRLAGPFEDGAIVYVTEKDEPYRFWVGSSRDQAGVRQLELPEGKWVLGGTVQAGSRGVVVMSQRDDVRFAPVNWIAAVDVDTLKVVASMRRDVELARIKLDRRLTGVVGATRQARIVLLWHTDAAWRVEAVDLDTMVTVWETTLPVAQPHLEGIVGISGDDAHVLVTVGEPSREGISVSDAFVLDLKTGKELRSMKKLALVYDLVEVVPMPGRASVALLYRYALSSHEPQPREGFEGVTELDLLTGSERVLVEANYTTVTGEDFKRLRMLDARAIVAGTFGVAIAPRSEHAALRLGAEYRPKWLDDKGSGRDSASVRGLVTTPGEWHRRSNPQHSPGTEQ